MKNGVRQGLEPCTPRGLMNRYVWLCTRRERRLAGRCFQNHHQHHHHQQQHHHHHHQCAL
ncbi:hypothetical protein O3P69_013740 [Scylla paramamosain]|uniref:Uncharacterized protein n=1 Tax=Scylla paramamosain TaxID=85552 RepID=A0AAW0SRC9_SCYPA